MSTNLLPSFVGDKRKPLWLLASRLDKIELVRIRTYNLLLCKTRLEKIAEEISLEVSWEVDGRLYHPERD